METSEGESGAGKTGWWAGNIYLQRAFDNIDMFDKAMTLRDYDVAFTALRNLKSNFSPCLTPVMVQELEDKIKTIQQKLNSSIVRTESRYPYKKYITKPFQSEAIDLMYDTKQRILVEVQKTTGTLFPTKKFTNPYRAVSES